MLVNRANMAEEEYFRRQEAEQRSDEAWDRLQQTTQANRTEALQPAPLSRCPKCGAALVPGTLRGVEIEQCGECHGTWLDPGKLERLTDHAPGTAARLWARLRGG
jgi:hypothetical protein